MSALDIERFVRDRHPRQTHSPSKNSRPLCQFCMNLVPPNRSQHNSQSELLQTGAMQTDVALWIALHAARGAVKSADQKAALGQIYDRHAGLVYGISFKVLGNAQEAEDLTQDIFVRLAERADYDPTRGSLRTFLMVLTRSRAIDRVRSRQSTQRSKTRWQADYVQPTTTLSPSDIHSDIYSDEQSQAVKAALDQLSEQQKQVLHLTYYEGLTQSAIAERLGVPLGTVKSYARRGLLQLRKILQNRQGEVAQ